MYYVCNTKVNIYKKNLQRLAGWRKVLIGDVEGGKDSVLLRNNCSSVTKIMELTCPMAKSRSKPKQPVLLVVQLGTHAASVEAVEGGVGKSWC